jgi:diadenosine tetraphosphate (Ap4A) HIT family hydrolase
MFDDCYSCNGNARMDRLPPREAILVEGGWRVAHAFGTSLPGWLVVVPLRHVTALHELSEAELSALGPIVGRLSGALERVVGAAKSYCVFYAEQEGFSHVHLHVVPRMPWFTDEQRGPRAFVFLGVPDDEALSEEERDAISVRVTAALLDD